MKTCGVSFPPSAMTEVYVKSITTFLSHTRLEDTNSSPELIFCSSQMKHALWPKDATKYVTAQTWQGGNADNK